MALKLATMNIKLLPTLVKNQQRCQALWMMWLWWMERIWAKRCPHEFFRVCRRRSFFIPTITLRTAATRQTFHPAEICSQHNRIVNLNQSHIVRFSQHRTKHRSHLDRMLNIRIKADRNTFGSSKKLLLFHLHIYNYKRRLFTWSFYILSTVHRTFRRQHQHLLIIYLWYQLEVTNTARMQTMWMMISLARKWDPSQLIAQWIYECRHCMRYYKITPMFNGRYVTHSL